MSASTVFEHLYRMEGRIVPKLVIDRAWTEPVAADWNRVEAVIAHQVVVGRMETTRMVEEALVAIDIKLGFPTAFINRARAQRARFARQRSLQGVIT